MSDPFKPTSLAALREFSFERVLNEGNLQKYSLKHLDLNTINGPDPLSHSLTLLGNFPSTQGSATRAHGIIKIEKLALASNAVCARLARDLLARTQLVESTDIVRALSADPALRPSSDARSTPGCMAGSRRRRMCRM